LVKLIAPYGPVGQIEMKCIFNIGKNISTLAKVTQVSDVAYGPLVFYTLETFHEVLLS
jgi:hypothetical protein